MVTARPSVLFPDREVVPWGMLGLLAAQPLIGLVTPPTRLGLVLPPPRSRLDVMTLSSSVRPWSALEDQALVDEASAFTVGEGENIATFWEALAASSLALCDRTASECEARMNLLSVAQPRRAHGSQPQRIEAWARLPDGRVSGESDGRVVWLTVSAEGVSPGGPQFVRSVSGRVYELGERCSEGTADADADEGSAPTPLVLLGRPATGLPRKEFARQVRDLSSALGAGMVLAVCAGGLGLQLVGAISVSLVSSSAIGTQAPSPPPAVAASASSGTTAAAGLDRASLTVGEQKARQQLRLDTDRAALREVEARLRDGGVMDAEQRERASTRAEALRLRIRAEQEDLDEVSRVVAERAAVAGAVQLGVFPPPSLEVRQGPER